MQRHGEQASTSFVLDLGRTKDRTEFILRLTGVKERTGLSRSSIYLKINQKTFPKPVALGARAVGWRESDINAWIAGCVAKA
ncbi:MAG TPA: AlpA family transcriptional regulator [Acidobacteriaceae bacterium]|jgi:prophage regulatory protein